MGYVCELPYGNYGVAWLAATGGLLYMEFAPLNFTGWAFWLKLTYFLISDGISYPLLLLVPWRALSLACRLSGLVLDILRLF